MEKKNKKKTISPQNINTVEQLECKQSLCNCTEMEELEQKQGGEIFLGGRQNTFEQGEEILVREERK